jgi:hypothetical protein
MSRTRSLSLRVTGQYCQYPVTQAEHRDCRARVRTAGVRRVNSESQLEGEPDSEVLPVGLVLPVQVLGRSPLALAGP